MCTTKKQTPTLQSRKNLTTKKALKKESSKDMFGYGDRARRALCDPQYLERELKNVEAVFVENGYARKEVQTAMQQKEQQADENEEEQTI